MAQENQGNSNRDSHQNQGSSQGRQKPGSAQQGSGQPSQGSGQPGSAQQQEDRGQAKHGTDPQSDQDRDEYSSSPSGQRGGKDSAHR